MNWVNIGIILFAGRLVNVGDHHMQKGWIIIAL
jgi:hypothetical protein